MLARCLVDQGYEVMQFISNFEHRSKTFRSSGHHILTPDAGYTIHMVPSIRYRSHVSFRRIRYERTFARNLLQLVKGAVLPDFIILAEPSLFYYDILLNRLLLNGKSALVLDVIDVWPELFELVIPRRLRALSDVVLAPLYYWRKRLYRHANAIVAVARDYLEIARRLTQGNDVLFEVVYWSYDSRERAGAAPVDPAVESLIASKPREEVWVVYAGTLGENYDIQAIIDVAGRLPADLQDRARVRFIVAGDGPQKQLCETHANDGLVFLGRLGAADLRVLYQHCDIALCTYKGESTVAMPIKAFDYLRYGLPMVNSLGRDLGELVRTHELGINYDPHEPSSLYRAIEGLVSDERLRRRCSVNARRLAEEFSSDAQYRKFANVLDRLSRSRSAQ
jgi:glycosyltransferase involved in cell wall biosynthesis